jgi:hypothetical protein
MQRATRNGLATTAPSRDSSTTNARGRTQQVNARVDPIVYSAFEQTWRNMNLKQSVAVQDALTLWMAYVGQRYDVLVGEIVTSKNSMGEVAAGEANTKTTIRVLPIDEFFGELFSESNSGSYIRMNLEPIEKYAASEEDNVSAKVAKQVFNKKPDAAFPLMEDGSIGKRKLSSYKDWIEGEQAKGETTSFLAVWGTSGKSTLDIMEKSRIGIIVSNDQVKAFRYY